MVLGLAFLVLQYQGWQALTAIGVELTTNPSGSFVYVISGVHAAHILGGNCRADHGASACLYFTSPGVPRQEAAF